jgi:hypothetical protein
MGHIPCYVGPCHHVMARPQVADGGDHLQIWRIAANMESDAWDWLVGWKSVLRVCVVKMPPSY